MFRSIAAIIFVLIIQTGCAEEPKPADTQRMFNAVFHNDADYAKRWLASGGNPNAKNEQGESLLYVATGPKGGNEVLSVLLTAGADPNTGQGVYTPLMNAASWVNLAGVELLLKSGADSKRKNERGESALETTGRAGGKEKLVLERIRESQSALR